MNYYNEIKKELIDNEVNKKIKDYSKNKYELQRYYNVGKLLSEAGKHYGKSIIKEYSKRLSEDLNLNYTKSSLYNMLKFYCFAKEIKFQTLSGNLSWSHYCEILSISDLYQKQYYINLAESKNLSVRQLRQKIKSKEYDRLDETVKLKIINSETTMVEDFIKNPIIIKNSNNYEVICEKVLQKLILEDITSFLDELGSDFCFIRNEYKIKIGDQYNYIDLLLYNIKFRCYVVVELKVTELKKEHIGQIEIYMNYIDKNIKTIEEDKTIGIIIVRKNNQFIMEYCSDKRIVSREYEIC